MSAAFESLEQTRRANEPARREEPNAAHLFIESPVGMLVLRESTDALSQIAWCRSGVPTEPDMRQRASPLLAAAARQLDEYFAGRRRSFELPLAPVGSPFQKSVWNEMCRIPYGATARYGDLARMLGTAAQPVGQACGANPIPIVIPCHRVVAAGSLGGYSGGDGLASKRYLLRLEGALAELPL